MSTYKFAPYSYSKISCYKECPKRFKFNYIDKLRKFDDAPHFEKGRFFHFILEHYPNLPPKKFKFRHFDETKQDEFISLVKHLLTNDTKLINLLTKYRLQSEYTFYLNDEMNPVKKKKESLIYGIIDYLGKSEDEVLIVDWKTGKSKASLDQLKLYSIWAFAAMPQINKIRVMLYYLEQDEIQEEVLLREDSKNVILDYINTINSIEKDTEFKTKRKSSCEWCVYLNECTKGDLKEWRNT
jgi:CRISPR/Cas system-associated exonuclease Cas4 (RecB family)